MEGVALLAAEPFVRQHPRHRPLSSVCLRAGVTSRSKKRPTAGDGPGFRNTGMSHLLAISGLHVGVLVVTFLAAASWLLGRRGWYFLAVLLIVV